MVGSLWKIKTLKNRNIPLKLETKVFDTCLLSVLIYDTRMWVFPKKIMLCLSVLKTQRCMERAMLGVRLRDRMPNKNINNVTRVQDITERVA